MGAAGGTGCRARTLTGTGTGTRAGSGIRATTTSSLENFNLCALALGDSYNAGGSAAGSVEAITGGNFIQSIDGRINFAGQAVATSIVVASNLDTKGCRGITEWSTGFLHNRVVTDLDIGVSSRISVRASDKVRPVSYRVGIGSPNATFHTSSRGIDVIADERILLAIVIRMTSPMMIYVLSSG